MNKNKISSYLTLFAVCTFLAIFVFIVQTSYNKLIGPIKEAQSNALGKPINPSLDVDTLNLIESRQEYPSTLEVVPTAVVSTESSLLQDETGN